jgi:biopolymer transport protein ExbB/TolQ
LEATTDVLTALENGLFALGQVLRFPVMVLLWICVLAVLFMAGATLVEFIARRRERQGFHLNVWLDGGPALEADETRRRSLPASLRTLLLDVEKEKAERNLPEGTLEHLVLESEERVRRNLTGPRMLVRVGPSVGLVGTLIPMGASLAALASGNLGGMAGQMVVAFTTAIVGLATGTLAYVVATVRLSWVNEAVREQRYLAERIAAELRTEDASGTFSASAVAGRDS